MTETEKLINEVLELDAKATPGHWQKVSSLPVYAVCTQGEWGVWDVVTATGREYARHAHHEKHGSKSEDADLIAHYRTAAPKLAKALREALHAIKQADLHCEAIALSSLLPPSEVGDYGQSRFFEGQATKSVGSGGRAHFILKESLTRIEEILKGEA